MAFTKTICRCAIDINKIDDGFEAITGQNPTIWVRTDVEFQFAFFDGSDENAPLADVANFDSVSMAFKVFERTGALISPKTVSSGDINKTLTKEQWSAGTHQHVSVDFTYTETAFDLGSDLKKNFWLVVYGTTSDVPVGKDVWGGATLTVLQSGIDPDEETLPTQPGNVIPVGAEYDVDGNYELAVTEGRTYAWTKNANDIGVINGLTEFYDVNGSVFIAASGTIMLTGTAGELVTAVIRVGVFLNSDESDARYFLRNRTNANDLLLDDNKIYFEFEANDPEDSWYSRLTKNGFQMANLPGDFYSVWSAAANGTMTVGVGLILPFASAGFITVSATGQVQLHPFDDLGIRLKDGQLQFWDATTAAATPETPWRAFGIDNGQPFTSDPIAD